eukprot:scaffold193023_cov25-Prasinocladus_malaysianus.AAC.1
MSSEESSTMYAKGRPSQSISREYANGCGMTNPALLEPAARLHGDDRKQQQQQQFLSESGKCGTLKGCGASLPDLP